MEPHSCISWFQQFQCDKRFKVVEFDHFKMQAGLPSFVLSPSQVIEQTNVIGIYVKSGRYGGFYAKLAHFSESGSSTLLSEIPTTD
jgi:hypothetical protein